MIQMSVGGRSQGPPSEPPGWGRYTWIQKPGRPRSLTPCLNHSHHSKCLALMAPLETLTTPYSSSEVTLGGVSITGNPLWKEHCDIHIGNGLGSVILAQVAGLGLGSKRVRKEDEKGEVRGQQSCLRKAVSSRVCWEHELLTVGEHQCIGDSPGMAVGRK